MKSYWKMMMHMYEENVIVIIINSIGKQLIFAYIKYGTRKELSFTSWSSGDRKRRLSSELRHL